MIVVLSWSAGDTLGVRVHGVEYSRREALGSASLGRLGDMKKTSYRLSETGSIEVNVSLNCSIVARGRILVVHILL